MKIKPTYEELERRVQELEKIESELEYSKEMLRVYEKAPLGYQSLDENGYIIVVNQTWLDFLGYTKEEVIGKSFAEFLHPDWRNHFKENFPRFKAVGEILGVDFAMVKKDGDIILVSFTGKITSDKKGDFQQAHCIFHDITNHRQHGDELRIARELSARIIEDGPVAITLVDCDGKIVFSNRHAERLFDLEKPNIEDLDYNSSEWLIVDVDGSHFPDERLPFRQVMSTGQAVYNVQHAITCPDAARKTLSINGAPLHDEQGRIDRVVFVILDITERKEFEEALQEREEHLRLILQHSPDIIFTQDADLRYTWICNPAFPFSKEQVVGKMDSDLLPVSETERITLIKRRVIRTGESFHKELKLTPGEGKARWYDVIYEPQKNADGCTIGLIGYSRDITARKNSEDERERLLKQLKGKTVELEDTNIALKILLKKRDEDNLELQENIYSNYEITITPFLNKLKDRLNNSNQQNLLDIIATNLQEIVAPFAKKLSNPMMSLTSSEIQIAIMIKQGYSNKEIATILNSSKRTIDTHRQNIRRKLQLKNEKVNLKTYLMNL